MSRALAMTAFSLDPVELGMVVLAMQELDPADHRGPYFRLRSVLTKAWSEVSPEVYGLTVQDGQVRPWQADLRESREAPDRDFRPARLA